MEDEGSEEEGEVGEDQEEVEVDEKIEEGEIEGRKARKNGVVTIKKEKQEQNGKKGERGKEDVVMSEVKKEKGVAAVVKREKKVRDDDAVKRKNVDSDELSDFEETPHVNKKRKLLVKD